MFNWTSNPPRRQGEPGPALLAILVGRGRGPAKRRPAASPRRTVRVGPAPLRAVVHRPVGVAEAKVAGGAVSLAHARSRLHGSRFEVARGRQRRVRHLVAEKVAPKARPAYGRAGGRD